MGKRGEGRVTAIIEKNAELLSALARQGHVIQGRGAIIVVEPAGTSGFVNYETSYVQLSSPAFDSAEGARQDVADYDPSREYVVVFVAGSDEILTRVVPLTSD